MSERFVTLSQGAAAKDGVVLHLVSEVVRNQVQYQILDSGLFGGHGSILNTIELTYPDGTRVVPNNKDLITGVPKGTRYYQVAGGGGGYGDPKDRDRDLLKREIRDRLISGEAARDIYGLDSQ